MGISGEVQTQIGALPAGDLPNFKLEADNGAVAGGGGEFSCAAVYPSPKQSLQLGRQNLHLFRFKNTRFDIIGGAFYFLMVVSHDSFCFLLLTMKQTLAKVPRHLHL